MRTFVILHAWLVMVCLVGTGCESLQRGVDRFERRQAQLGEINRLELVREREPNDVKTLVRLGELYRELGDLDRSERYLLKAIDENYRSAEAHHQLGYTHMDAGRSHLAQEHWRRAVTLDSGLADAHAALGKLYRSLDDLERAESALLLAVDLEPGRAEYHFELGVLAQMRQAYDEALQRFERAVDVNPQHTAARMHVAALRGRRGEYGSAYQIWRQLAKESPDNFLAHYNLGLVAARRDDLPGALKSWRVCRELADTVEPELRAWLYVNIAQAQRRLGIIDEAKDAAEQARQLDPGNQAAWNVWRELAWRQPDSWSLWPF